MSSSRTHVQIEAPIQEVWELVGNPERHPEWWPGMIEVKGESFDLGDEYVLVSHPSGTSRDTTNFLIEKREDLREIKLRCQKTGTYSEWRMTESRGGTFVEVEFGMDPKRFRDRIFDTTMGRRFFRQWVEESIEALKDAVAEPAGSRR